MTEEQLSFVDSFEDSIRAEANSDYLELYNEYSALEETYIELQRNYITHLEFHTKYISTIHKEVELLHKQLRSASVASNFYIMLSLVCIGYIIFNHGV